MIYKRKGSPYWTAAFYVKGADGKLIKRAFSTKTIDKEKAFDIERELKRVTQKLSEKKRFEDFIISTAEKIKGQVIKRPGLPLSIVWEKYSSHQSQSKRTERTQNTKKIVWNRFARWLKEKYPQINTINEVSRDVADSYLKTIKGKSSSTYNNEKNSLSSIWHILTVEAGLKENIWRLFKSAENDSIRYRDFSLEEMRSIIANSEGFWCTASAIAYYTGLRFKDVVHLKKSQIQGDYIVLMPAKTKRKHKNVNIFISYELRKILDYQATLIKAEEDYFFPEAVKQYGKATFHSVFGTILDKCGITENARGKVSFHSIRHTFVTVNEEIGTDRKIIQGIVGHGSPVMTGHYSHDLKSIRQIGKMPSLLT